MKGDRKRKAATTFQKGHRPHNKGKRYKTDESEASTSSSQPPVTRRLNSETYSIVTVQSTVKGRQSTVNAPDCEGRPGSARILRAAAAATKVDSRLKQTTELASNAGTRMVDKEKLEEMINSVIRLHIVQFRDCDKPTVKIATEKKWGLGWKFQLRCESCKFTSPKYKLYKEIKTNKPGPNPAAINRSFQAGLQDTPMGNTRARYLLAATDIPPPARSAMQRASNVVGMMTKHLNEKDMQDKLELVRKTNEMRGVEKPAEINVAFDGRYNSISIGHSKKPGQGSSQAIGTACETVTDREFIVGMAVENKLCWTGAWLRGKGFHVKCPGGHPDCTANLAAVAPHSEYEMAKKIGTQFLKQQMFVRHVTTDGDAKAAAGFQDAYKVLHPMWKVERLSDPTHLGRSQFRKCMSATFSKDMFPGVKTRDVFKGKQKILSQDVKARCSLVFKKLMEETVGDMRLVKSQLPLVLESTLLCYSGDCSKCRRHAKVCGGGHTTSWWTKSAFLGPHKITGLNMTSQDESILLEILKMKLSYSAAEQLKLNTDTQKCEAVNRSLSVSLPKNVNYSRNFEARAHSAVHRLNNKVGKSLEDKIEHLGATLSPVTKRALSQIQKESEYHKEYRKRPETQRRAIQRHGSMIKTHLQYRQLSSSRQSDYRKGQLDLKSQPKGDHLYALP